MKIHFTKKEYLLLLDMLQMADWVMNSHKTRDQQEEETKDYGEVIQKIYSYAKEARCDHLLEKSRHSEELFPTKDYEVNGRHRALIGEFEEPPRECSFLPVARKPSVPIPQKIAS